MLSKAQVRLAESRDAMLAFDYVVEADMSGNRVYYPGIARLLGVDVYGRGAGAQVGPINSILNDLADANLIKVGYWDDNGFVWRDRRDNLDVPFDSMTNPASYYSDRVLMRSSFRPDKLNDVVTKIMEYRGNLRTRAEVTGRK